MALYRNKKLLQIVRECPCQVCGIEDGTVVAAHSNQMRDGKSISMKSNDYRIAAMCYNCHSNLDQGSKLTREERVDMWENAHRKTIGWLFENEHLEVIRNI